MEKFPLGGQLRDQLLQQLGSGGDFEEDIQPILGKQHRGRGHGRRLDRRRLQDNFVAAIEAGNKEALENAVEKEGAESTGKKSGATLFKDVTVTATPSTTTSWWSPASPSCSTRRWSSATPTTG